MIKQQLFAPLRLCVSLIHTLNQQRQISQLNFNRKTKVREFAIKGNTENLATDGTQVAN